MSRYHSYVNSAREILKTYTGIEPFASFIKKYFSVNKKFGSKDRKNVNELCYCYFRVGKMGEKLPIEERMLTGLFLCSGEPNELLAGLKPEWNDKSQLSLAEKCSILNGQCSMPEVFPWADELSETVDHGKFCESFFKQPGLYLRIRPGNEKTVAAKLASADIPYIGLGNNCLQLPNAASVDRLINLDKEAVVQDYSSQRVAELFSLPDMNKIKSVWDCCAASGGKSLLLHDVHPAVNLTVSDKRESIIANLKKRFARAGINRYKALVTDLSSGEHAVSKSKFDLIIADVPCTGSGTWSRTPEQLYYFKKEKIGEYAALQRKIVSNVIPSLKQDGFLLYITCSVFKKENEENVAFIQKQFGLKLIKMEMFKGYDRRADTLLAALLQLAS